MSKSPNVVYILADDMGYGDVEHLNPECKIPTPNLNRLGREGMSFSDAHSSSAVCTPSRYSILTGQYCWRTYLKKGVLSGVGNSLIDDGQQTFAHLAKRVGYKTACIGKWHIGWEWAVKDGHKANRDGWMGDQVDWVDYTQPIKRGPLDAGFDEFYGICGSLDMPPYVYVDGDQPVAEATAWVEADEFYRAGPAMEGLRANAVLGELTDKAVEFISRQKNDEPFFLYFPLTAPHTPIAPSPEFVGKSTIGAYGDFCMEVDHRVGQVMQALEDHGLSEDTILVFTTDNGASPVNNPEKIKAEHDHASSHIYRGYKSDIWDGGHRIPFMVKWPSGIPANSWCDHPIGIFDTIATFAELHGLADVEGAIEDAVSFLPCFKGEKPQERLLVHHSIDGMFGVRSGDWKLCRCAGSGGWSKPTDEEAMAEGLPSVQLYRMSDDPSEGKNLSEDYPEVVAELTQKCHTLVTKGGANLEDWDQVNWIPEIPERYVLDD